MNFFKLSKKYIFIVFATLLCSFCFNPTVAFAQNNNIKQSGTGVKPAFIDLGNIENKITTFDVTVYNYDKTSSFTAKIEGKGREFIDISPSTFELEQGKNKDVKVKINDAEKLDIGPYDLSITFVPNNNSKEWVSAIPTSSLRLKFIKEGISSASLNVHDLEKSQNANFHIIFGNFIDKKVDLDVLATIINKKDNRTIAEFKEKLSMSPYPNSDFYGTMKIPWLADVKMGDYIFKVDASTNDGVSIHEEKTFVVGLLKGKLVNVSIEDTKKGNPFKLVAKVKNIGNLKLPTTLNAVIKNSSGEKVFESKIEETISKGVESDLVIQWPTDKAKTGNYTVEYTVNMGNDSISDTVQFKVLNSSLFYIIIVLIILILISIILYIILRKKKFINHN